MLEINKQLELLNKQLEDISREFDSAYNKLEGLLTDVDDFISNLPDETCTSCGDPLGDNSYFNDKRTGTICMSCYYDNGGNEPDVAKLQRMYDDLLIVNDELIDENSDLKNRRR